MVHLWSSGHPSMIELDTNHSMTRFTTELGTRGNTARSDPTNDFFLFVPISCLFPSLTPSRSRTRRNIAQVNL